MGYSPRGRKESDTTSDFTFTFMGEEGRKLYLAKWLSSSVNVFLFLSAWSLVSALCSDCIITWVKLEGGADNSDT